MTPTSPAYPATERRRHIFVPAPAGTVQPAPQPQPQPPQPLDPPIYRDLLRTWSDRGRTLPGRYDPEWVRLAAPTVAPGQFSGSPDPLGGGR